MFRFLKYIFTIFVIVIFCTSSFLTAIDSSCKEHIKTLEEFFFDKTLLPYAIDYYRELKKIQTTLQPKIDPTITHVHVLSARYSFFYHPLDGPGYPDKEDDRNRIFLGIKIAREVVAAKLNIKENELTKEQILNAGPLVVYNGHPQQNAELLQAFEQKLITSYPIEKFKILSLDPKHVNTFGQFMSFKQNFSLSNTAIAIVTHAFHFPRILRMFGKNIQMISNGDNIKIYAFLFDREFCTAGINKNVKGEIERLKNYYLNDFISNKPSESITFY